jgi:hypothetical protein
MRRDADGSKDATGVGDGDADGEVREPRKLSEYRMQEITVDALLASAGTTFDLIFDATLDGEFRPCIWVRLGTDGEVEQAGIVRANSGGWFRDADMDGAVVVWEHGGVPPGGGMYCDGCGDCRKCTASRHCITAADDRRTVWEQIAEGIEDVVTRMSEDGSLRSARRV